MVDTSIRDMASHHFSSAIQKSFWSAADCRPAGIQPYRRWTFLRMTVNVVVWFPQNLVTASLGSARAGHGSKVVLIPQQNIRSCWYAAQRSLVHSKFLTLAVEACYWADVVNRDCTRKGCSDPQKLPISKHASKRRSGS